MKLIATAAALGCAGLMAGLVAGTDLATTGREVARPGWPPATVAQPLSGSQTGRKTTHSKYTTALATRQQFEAALARQKKTIMPLAATDTLRRLVKMIVQDDGSSKQKLKAYLLRLRLANNTTKTLTSKPSESGFEVETDELTYVGKISAMQKYVLHAQQYEFGAYLLVDRKTGKTDTLGGFPIGSPSLQRLAALSLGYPYEDQSNDVEVYNAPAGNVKKAFLISSKKWLPYDLAWVNDDEFIVKTLTIAEAEKAEKLNRALTPAEEKKQKFTYLRVTITKQLSK